MPPRKPQVSNPLVPQPRVDSIMAATPVAKPAGAKASQQRSIQSIEIGFTLINALERADGPLSLKEAAQRAGMSASKAHFYMVSFKRVGLVEQSSETGHYTLGRYALDLGLSALRRLDLVGLSREAMQSLSARIGESLFLSVWGNHGPTIVFKVDGPRPTPMTLQIGYVLPLLRSATGRIFLSYLPVHTTADYLSREIAALTPKQRAALDADKLTQRVRKQEMADTDSLLNSGFAGLSAPIWNHQDELAAALTIISPSDTMGAGGAHHVDALRDTARMLSRALGAPRAAI